MKKATVVADDSAGLFTTNQHQIASTNAEFKNSYWLILAPHARPQIKKTIKKLA